MMHVYKIGFFAMFICLGLFSKELQANNLQISTQPRLEYHSLPGHSYIVFDMSWDNSWRMASPFNNWDAVWVFAKFKPKNNSDVWKPVYLDPLTSNHKVSNTQGVYPNIEAGTSSNGSQNKVLGLFMYRQSQGQGNIQWQNIKLSWNRQAQTAVSLTDIEIDVFALEMVYIPEGSFSLGSAGSETYAFKSTDSLIPYVINSENALLLSKSPANPSALGTASDIWQASGAEITLNTSLPQSFPKGYKAFYIMKYELSQEAYKDFLNTLTPEQQKNRSGKLVNDANINAYTYNRSYRNGIMLIKEGLDYKYVCNYSNDGVGEENINRFGDGQNIAMNYISLEDQLAYLSWAGLRPMTELEYEKTCRGPIAPVANEYAWGNNMLFSCDNPETTAADAGAGGERPNIGIYNGTKYPIRCGAFATQATNRVGAGASFYGVMELTSNMSERYINLQYAGAFGFTHNHGDGVLDAAGNINTHLAWPTAPQHYLFRGGVGSSYLEVSNRYYCISGRTPAARDYYIGCRGGRTAE